MSSIEVPKDFIDINKVLEQRYTNGQPVSIPFVGLPDFRLTSLAPPEVQKYGLLRNHAPYLQGAFAVRALFEKPTGPDDPWPYVVALHSEEGEHGLVIRPWHCEGLTNALHTAGFKNVDMCFES